MSKINNLILISLCNAIMKFISKNKNIFYRLIPNLWCIRKPLKTN